MARAPRTTLEDILPILHDMLAAGTGLAPDRIKDTLDDDGDKLPVFVGPHDLWLRALEEVPDTEFFEGSAKLDRRVTRQLRLTLRTRCLLDPVAQATQFLENAATGHLQFEGAVFASLDDECPFDADNNQLTTCSMECLGIGLIAKMPDRRDWAGSTMRFKLRYRRRYPGQDS